MILSNNDFYGPIPSFLTELCLTETTFCSSHKTNDFAAMARESGVTLVLHAPRKPTALITASATTASTPQTFIAHLVQAASSTLQAHV
ncbi:hypothetical protein TrLO_g14837 [Triparma laevis f. longispina]|uniref:Uncharacterized protein n=1 Tax=Triparma laevis f. longispina TaxID=1714387 RepID=A0A9W7L058_9STRA|nr:hypothetical protein TrLO_g14837 [Triparma laevis f. longispina]